MSEPAATASTAAAEGPGVERRRGPGRKFAMCFASLACAMAARHLAWIDGAQLVAWATFSVATYAGGNVGARLADGLQAWLASLATRARP